MKFAWVFLKVIHLDVNLDVNFATVFNVILQVPSAGITATSLLNLGEVWLRTSTIINEINVKFDWVFQKLFI